MHSARPKKPKKDKIKREKVDVLPVETQVVSDTEKDLTHFIKDRVELMKQVFSILKDRELLAMAPQCLRTLEVDDVQELCLDEVLGISSKRLHSILDGFECPSDTDSSQEAISLDSISSDEGTPLKVKKKAHHKTKRRQRASPVETQTASSAAPVAGPPGQGGMTVLELLELQARARAIRAQLQAVHANIDSETEEGNGTNLKAEGESGDEEVVIKEEPAEVVELVSSSDESLREQKKPTESKTRKAPTASTASERPAQTKSLVVSMPVIVTQHPPRKIKLNRNNLLVSVSNVQTQPPKPVANDIVKPVASEKIDPIESVATVTTIKEADVNAKRPKNKGIGKVTKKKKSSKHKSNVDEDEIMLELSDTEKMDLLDSFNSSSDASAESEAADSEAETRSKQTIPVQSDVKECTYKNAEIEEKTVEIEEKTIEIDDKTDEIEEKALDNEETVCESVEKANENVECLENAESIVSNVSLNASEDILNDVTKTDMQDSNERDKKKRKKSKKSKSKCREDEVDEKQSKSKSEDIAKETDVQEKDLSEGECSYSSDGIEITEPRHDVVCISDEDSADSTKGGKPKKKKYRKRRKSSNSSNQGVIESVAEVKRDALDLVPEADKPNEDVVVASKETAEESFDLEIFEISDEWSDDGVICLSKEPTTEEIEELSKKVDSEIQREEIVFEKSITGDVDDETKQEILKSVGASGEELTDNSWKERWLQSDKVKRVLATSNLCNAMRKKNKEIKTKLGEVKTNEEMQTNEESNKEANETEDAADKVAEEKQELGSVDFYMTLPSCTKYVDPKWAELEKQKKEAMTKDARQLMRMYKKLLKIHKDQPEKKKKKKKKDKKDKKKTAAAAAEPAGEDKEK